MTTFSCDNGIMLMFLKVNGRNVPALDRTESSARPWADSTLGSILTTHSGGRGLVK